MPQTTFKAVSEPLDPATAAALPAFTEPVKPATGGNFKLLRVEAGSTVAKLEPGEYLVDESGKVVQKVERNFPATLRADTSNLGRARKSERCTRGT